MTDTPSNYGYAVGGRALKMCLRCGSLVGDTDLHDTYHDDIENAVDLAVGTSAAMIALIDTMAEPSEEDQ